MTEQLSQIAAVTHLEIPALKEKQQEIATFYHEIFGWNITFDQLPNYGMTTNNQGMVSIGLPLVDEIFPIGNIYILVQDIDTTLSKVKELGGEVLTEKNKISDDIGFGATFKDLSGNKIGLFSPTQSI